MKIKLPNGIEVEGEFSLDDLIKLPWTVPAVPVVPEPNVTPIVPNTTVPGWFCTCPKVWFGIFPPPPCSYCISRGVRPAPFVPFISINGASVVNGFAPDVTQR